MWMDLLDLDRKQDKQVLKATTKVAKVDMLMLEYSDLEFLYYFLYQTELHSYSTALQHEPYRNYPIVQEW